MTTIIQIVYLVYYKPFKEAGLFLSCIIGDLCVLIVFSLSILFLVDLNPQVSYFLETICVYTVIAAIGIQFLISTHSLWKSFNKIFRKIMKYRADIFIKVYDEISIKNTPKQEIRVKIQSDWVDAINLSNLFF